MRRKIAYRVVFLGLTILIIPLVPIAIIFAGVSSPEYVIKGTLNIDLSQMATLNYWEVYTSFLSHIIRFDLGTSVASGKPVIGIVLSGINESLKIMFASILFSYIVGTFVGICIERSKRANRVWNSSQFVFYVPIIVFSYLLLYFLSFIGADFLSPIKYAAAMLALSVYPIYIVANTLKKTLQELRDSDFFMFHKALGFDSGQIWRKFCHKFIAIDYLSFLENMLIFMMGFLFFVETPFGIPGMGYTFIVAIQRFDYPVIIGFCIFAIIFLSIVGLIVDGVKMRLDPRLVGL
ncbi:MAG: ABC transporter permease [Dehalococcoidia bacterium]|nr:ABC transporter permease [Dehalococcoidia bacterium]